MSIFDVLDDRKIKWTYSMGTKTDRKVLLPPKLAILLSCSLFLKIFQFFYTDVACKEICSPPRKDLSRRKEGTLDRKVAQIIGAGSSVKIMGSILQSLETNSVFKTVRLYSDLATFRK